MISKTVMTQQIDNTDKASDELLNNLFKDFSLLKNSCGILFCDSDMDQAALVQRLHSRLGFPIVGGTTVAVPNNLNIQADMAIVLLVLSDDVCRFSAAVSSAVAEDTITAMVSEAIAEVSVGFDEAPKLVFALPPYIAGTMLDEYADAFNAALPGVPVIGGIPSFQGEDGIIRNIYGDRAYVDRLILLAIYGDIRPLVSVANVRGTLMEKKVTVTSAKKNVIYKVGDRTFIEYMKDMGFDFPSIKSDISVPFFSSPLVIEQTNSENGDTYTFVRSIHKLNMEDESGITLGLVPEGASLALSSLTREDIEKTVDDAAKYIAEEILKEETRDPSYRYTTAITVSCVARYFLMSPNYLDAEARRVLATLPKDLSLIGFYSHGEIGPLPGTLGSCKNFAHTVSFVVCAF